MSLIAAGVLPLLLAGAALDPGPLLAPQASGTTAARALVEVAFTPGDDIEGLIIRRIEAARSTIHVQAYLFTSRRIGAALVGALRRGVRVEIVGDAAQHAVGGLPLLANLKRAGARVYLNGELAASHNKIVIVDAARRDAAIITGSYNFTQAAQSRNAENVVVISGNRAITERFVANFTAQRERSQAWP